MSFPIIELPAAEFPKRLLEIPQPPKELRYRGKMPPKEIKLLSVVGSRKYTNYGKQVTEDLIQGLAGLPVGVVSGLALGIDSLAHEAALRNGLYTLAIPGGGINDPVIYPATHKPLAHRILESGGGLLSEFEPNFKATQWSFPQRNRLVTGISHATLLIEAAEKSGTLITARMAADYNRDLMVVPGSIFSSNSKGVHQFLKLGAIPVTSSEDIIEHFGLEKTTSNTKLIESLTPIEQLVIKNLREPLHKDELARILNLTITELNQVLMMMELSGYIKSEQNIYHCI